MHIYKVVSEMLIVVQYKAMDGSFVRLEVLKIHYRKALIQQHGREIELKIG